MSKSIEPLLSEIAHAADTEQMYDDYLTGLTMAQVGKRWGITAATVQKRFSTRKPHWI